MNQMLAYSPLLHLVESHVAAYKIYVLRNPDTNEIFYVGQTVKSLQERLNGHLSCDGSNKPKNDYIKSLLLDGKRPIIEEIETIHGTCYRDKLALNEREIYWIKYYKSIGCRLLNAAATSPNAKCNEFHGYLASIKRGSTSWHYYYCGKTISGYTVYDEAKLKADGFRLPEPTPTRNESIIEPEYDPFKNPRFVAKMGYRKYLDERLCYVPCYKDTNPDYYDDDY